LGSFSAGKGISVLETVLAERKIAGMLVMVAAAGQAAEQNLY
jgi:hypothetical protein